MSITCNAKVFVRVRPLSMQEGPARSVSIDGRSISLTSRFDTKIVQFTMDQIGDESCTQVRRNISFASHTRFSNGFSPFSGRSLTARASPSATRPLTESMAPSSPTARLALARPTRWRVAMTRNPGVSFHAHSNTFSIASQRSAERYLPPPPLDSSHSEAERQLLSQMLFS
jgi:hypothetical protein